MSKLLLLVDGAIRDHDKIVAAVREDVVPLVFNSASDTYAEILAKVAGLGVASFSTVGIAQHGSASSLVYSLTRAESVRASLEDDDSMTSWQGLIGFFSTLRSTYGVGVVDLISCMIYSNPAWVIMLNRLEQRTGVNFRASKDATGNLANGGNWVMESDNVNIEGVYFTEAIREFKGTLLYRSPYMTPRQMVSASNKVPVPLISSNNPVNGMVRIMGSGSVTTYGAFEYGGDSSSVSSFLANNIKAIVSTNQAFAAINNVGAVVAWGDPLMGGSIPAETAPLLTSGVTAIASTTGMNMDDYTMGGAFAALKSNRSVVTWGNSLYGGDSSSVSSGISNGVIAIASTGYAFAALKSDGSVVTWGHGSYGGDSSTVSSSLSSGVIAIASTYTAFAALKNDGAVITWGNGLVSPASVSSDVTTIATSESVFAALKADGSVITWGGPGNGSGYTYNPSDATLAVVAISSNRGAFAALRADGSVITWGASYYGGSSSSINEYGFELSVASQLASGVTKITSSIGAFVALKDDNTLVAWGWQPFGGYIDYSELEKNTSNIISVAAVTDAFLAIRTNGELTTWGTKYLWTLPTSAPLLTSDVVSVATSFSDAIAIKQDRSAIIFGTDSVSYSGAEAIATNDYAFAVITTSTPGITSSTLTPTYGSSLTLSVTSPKELAAYQWYRNSEVISGATSSTLTFDKAYVGEADGIFYVKETLSRITAESNSILVQVQGGPSIIGPPGNTTFVGARLTLSTTSLGPTAVYNWTKNGVALEGITGPSYVVASASSQNIGSYGLTIVYKGRTFVCDPLSINIVEPTTPVITSTAESLANGGEFTVSVTPPVAESGYTWYKDDVPIPDVTTYTYTVKNATNVAHTGVYKVIYSLNDVEYTSNSVSVTVAAPSISADTDTPAFGGEFSVTLAVANLGATYQWYRNGSPIDGKVGTTLSYTSASALQNDGTYFLRQTAGGISEDSNTITITVGDPPAFEIRNDVGTYDADTQTYTLAVDYNGPFTIYAYSSTSESLNVPFMWFKDGVLIESVTGSTYTVSKATISGNNGTYTATAQIDGKEIPCINSVQVTVGPPAFLPTVDMTVPMVSVPNPVNRMVRVMAQGDVTSWGEVAIDYISATLEGVVALTSNEKAFAAIKSNGAVVTWGAAEFGGDSSAVAGQLTSGVVHIATTYGTLPASTHGAFAALKSDGSVVTWGYGPYGGDSTGVSGLLSSGVVAIAASATAFAALKSNGSVVSWGTVGAGGADSSLTSGVIALASTNSSFAALKLDGSVYSWGVEAYSIPSGVISIATTMDGAFTAIMDNGAIMSWGAGEAGGVTPDISGAAAAIASTKRAFAVLTESGKVFAWGDSAYGGIAPAISGSVSSVVANHGAFAALLADRTVVAWGDVSSGGVAPSGLSDVVYIAASDGPSFSAITSGGRVVSWGTIAGTYPYDIDAVSANVVSVAATANSIAAVKRDGSLVTWGASNTTLTNVIGLVASRYNFAAIRGAQTISATTTTPAWQNEFTLSVISATPSATYQWYRNDKAIDGATGSSYTVSNALNLQDGGIYYVRETVSGVTSESNSLLVTVGAPTPPAIMPLTERFEEGYDFTLGLVFGLPLVIYRWYREGVLLLTSTTSDASLNVVKPLIGENDGTYTVVMTTDGRDVTSAPYNVTLKVGPPVIKRRQEGAVIAGDPFEFYVWVVRAGATYAWFKDGDAITDASGTSYSVAQSNYFTDSGTYKVAMTLDGETLYSNELYIAVEVPAPVITATTEAPAYKSGFTLSVTSPFPSATYQWYRSDQAIEGATGTTYSVASATKVANGGVYFVRQSLSGYNTDSNTVTITVGAPSTPSVSADTTGPMATTSFTLSVTNAIEGATYTWYKDAVELVGATGVTYTATNVSVAASEGSYTVSQYVDERTAISAPVYIQITEPNDPIISTTTGAPAYGGAFTISVSSAISGATYQWFKNNVAISGATGATYAVPHATATANNGSYRVEQYLDIYTNSSSAITITVGAPPAPILFAWNATPTYKGYLHLALESETTLYGVDSAIYKWYKDGVELTGETGANYYKDPVDALTYDGTYTIQRTLDGQTSTSNAITVTVGAPAAPTLSVDNAAPEFYQSFTVSIASPYIGYGPVFSWYKDEVLLEGVTGAEYAVAKANGNLHTGSYTVVMELDGKIINGVASVDVAVGDPESPVISTTTSSPAFNAPFTITLQNPIEGLTYNLYRKFSDVISFVRPLTMESPSFIVDNAITSIHTGDYFAVFPYVGKNIASNTVNIGISTGPSIVLSVSESRPLFGSNVTITVSPPLQTYQLWRKVSGVSQVQYIRGGVGYVANAVTPSRSTGEFYIMAEIDGTWVTSNSIFITVTMPPMPSLSVLNGRTQVAVGGTLKFLWNRAVLDELYTQGQNNADNAGEYLVTGESGARALILDTVETRLVKDGTNYDYFTGNSFSIDFEDINSITYETHTANNITRDFTGSWRIEYAIASPVGSPSDPYAPPIILRSNSFDITVVSRPAISQQPVGGTMYHNGIQLVSSLELSVRVVEPGSYQWYRGTTAIPGATSAAYNVKGISLGRHQFYVKVSNAAGSLDSSRVTVTVKLPEISLGGGDTTRVPATITPAKEDVSCNLTLGFKQPNPTYDISYVLVTLRQEPYPTTMLTDPTTGYPPINGTVTRFQQTLTKRVGASEFSFSPATSSEGPYVYGQIATTEFYHNCAYNATVESFFRDGTTTLSTIDGIRNGNTEYVSVLLETKPVAEIQNTSISNAPEFSIRIKQQLVQEVRGEWDDGSIVHMRVSLAIPGSSAEPKMFDVSAPFMVDVSGDARMIAGKTISIGAPHIAFNATYEVRAHVLYRDLTYVSSDIYTIGPFVNPPANPYESDTLVSDTYNFIINDYLTATAIPGTERALDSSDSLVRTSNTEAIYYDSATGQYRDDGAIATGPVEFVTPYYYKRAFANVTSADSLYYRKQSMIQFFRSIGDADIAGISDENVSYDMLLDKILAIIDTDTSATGDSSYAVSGFTIGRAFRKLGVTNPLDVSKVYDLYYSDTVAARTIGFEYNAKGFLYRWYLWMAVDAAKVGVTSTDAGAVQAALKILSNKIIFGRKYVEGENVIASFNNRFNGDGVPTGVKVTLQQVDRTIYSQQFRDSDAKSFHRIVRLYRKWDTNHFDDQMERIDSVAFNSGATTEICMLSQYSSDIAVFKTTAAGNIALDPVHFPHIRDCFVNPKNANVLYNEKLFLIGHALLHGAPIYRAVKRKILNTAGQHVLTLEWDTIYDLSGEALYRCFDLTQDSSGRYLLPHTFKNVKTLRLTYYDPISQTFKPSYKPVVFQPGKLTVLEYNVDTNSFTSPQGSTYPISPEFAVPASTTVYTTEGEIVYTPLSRGVVFDTSLNTWNYKPQAAETVCNRVYDAQGSHRLTISGDELYAVDSPSAMRINYYTGKVTNEAGDLVYMYNYDLGEFTAANGGAKFVTRVPLYNMWYVSYIPPFYFANTAIAEATVSWRYVTGESYTDGSPPTQALRDAVYIGVQAYPVGSRLRVPTPYLDNAVTYIRPVPLPFDYFVPGGTAQEIFDLAYGYSISPDDGTVSYVFEGENFLIDEPEWPKTFRSNVATVPMHFFTMEVAARSRAATTYVSRTNMTYVNTRADHQLLRVPVGSVPEGCVMLRDYNKYAVLPGSASNPVRSGVEVATYSGITKELVIFSGIVYVDYYVKRMAWVPVPEGGSVYKLVEFVADELTAANFYWVVDAAHRNVRMPPIKISTPPHWAIQLGDMTIENLPFYADIDMAYYLDRKIYYSGLTYKKATPTDTIVAYDRIPTPSDPDRLSGTVYILHTPYEDGEQIKYFPSDIFGVYEGIDRFVLPTLLLVYNESLVDKQRYECGGATWRHERALGYPILEDLSTNDLVCLPYVQFYDYIFNENQNIVSVRNGRRDQNPTKLVGKRAFYLATKLRNFNFPVHTVDDEGFAYTADLSTNLVVRNGIRIGVNAIVGSSIRDILIEDTSGAIIDLAAFNGSHVGTITVRNSTLNIVEYAFRGGFGVGPRILVLENSPELVIGRNAFANNSRLSTVMSANNGCKEFGPYSFAGTYIRSVVFNTVGDVTIGEGAFQDTSSLGDISITSKIKSVGPSAFKNSGIENLTIVDASGLIIPTDTFSNTSRLNNVTIRSSTIDICDNAFSTAGTRYLRLESSPNLVIGSTVFAGAPNLESLVAVNNGCKEFGNSSFKSTPLRVIEFSASPEMVIGASAFEDTLLLDDLTLRGNVKELGTRAFYGSGIKNLLFEDVSGLTIPSDTFSNTPNLDLVTIRRSVVDISENAFFTRIKQLVMDNSPYLVVGDRAFFGVPNLYRVTATNNGCKEMGPFSFANTPLRILELNLSSDMTIGDSAFENTPLLESLTITGNIKSLGSRAFYSSGVQTISITDSSGLTIYGDTFNPAPRLDRLTITNTWIDISANAFSNTTLRLLELDGRGRLTIGDSAFENTPLLEGVTINGNSVKYLGARAFKNSGVKTISIVDLSDGVTTIGSDMFRPAPRLNSLTVRNSNLDISAYAFADTSLNTLDLGWNFTWVPSVPYFFDLTDASKANNFPDDYYIYINYYLKYKKTSVNIGPSVFEGTTQLGDVGLYWNIKSLGPRAFYGSGITNLTINDTSGLVIYNNTFTNTPRLNAVTITNSRIGMEDMAFVSSGVRSFTTGNTPDLVIPFKAFFEAPNLVSADMGGNGCKEIGAYAFANTPLRTLALNSVGNYTIGEGAFQDTSGLTSDITLGVNVRGVGPYAFRRSGITNLNIFNLNDVTLQGYIFANTPNLNTVLFHNSKIDLSGELFEGSGIRTLVISKDIWVPSLTSTPPFPQYYLEASKEDRETFYNNLYIQELSATAFYNTPATSIGYKAFFAAPNLTNVDLSNNGCREIGGYAFANTPLRTLFLNTVSDYTIGESAFEETPLLAQDISFNTNLKSIGPRAFYGSGITNISFTDLSGLPIYDSVFTNTRDLNTITIYNSTLSIQPYAFGVSDISAGDISSAGVRTLVLNNSPNLVISERAFYGAQNLTTVTSNVNGCNNFGPYSFAKCTQLSGLQLTVKTLKKIVEKINNLPNGRFETVYEEVDYYENMLDLVIGEGAFMDTIGFNQGINIYRGLAELGARAFKGSAITKFDIIIPYNPYDTISEYRADVIRNMASFSIKEETFMNTPNLGDLHMKYGIKNIEDRAFKNSGVTGVVLYNCPTINIGEEAFANTPRLQNVLLFGANIIKKRSFYNSSIHSIIFKRGYQAGNTYQNREYDSDFGIIIEEEAFRDTPNLRPLEIINSVYDPNDQQPLPNALIKSVGDRAFYNSGITEILFTNERLPSSAYYTGYDPRREQSLMIVDAITFGTESFYNSGLILFRIDASANIVLGHNMFGKCGSLETIRISGIMNDFDTSASDLSGLKYLDLTFDLSANTIIQRLNAPILETVILRGGFKSIDPNVFNGCANLKTATIFIQAGDITELPVNMFKDCVNLETVVIDSRVGAITSLPITMFIGCSKLKSVTIYANATTVPLQLFNPVITTLETVHITLASPNDSIIESQFRNCVSLKDVTVICPTGRVSLHPQIFSGCISLVNINIDAKIMSNLDNRDEWGGWAFKECVSLKALTLIFDPSGSYTTNIPYSGLTSLETLIVRGSADVKNTIGASSGDMLLYGGNSILNDSANLKYLEINGTLNGVLGRQSYFPVIEVFHVNYGRTTVIPKFRFMEILTLRKVVLTGALVTIDTAAFFGCTNLASLTLGNGLTRIEDMAFSFTGISGDVLIPETVRYLGEAYFAGCNNIKEIRYNCSVLDFVNPFIYTKELWNIIRDATGNVDISIRNGDNTEYDADISSTRATISLKILGDDNYTTYNTNIQKVMNIDAFNYRRTDYENLLVPLRRMYLDYTGETSGGAIKKEESYSDGILRDYSGNAVTFDKYKEIARDEMYEIISHVLEDAKDSVACYDKQTLFYSTVDPDLGISWGTKIQTHFDKFSWIPYTTLQGTGVGDAIRRIDYYNDNISNPQLAQLSTNTMRAVKGKPIQLPTDFDMTINSSEIYEYVIDELNDLSMNEDTSGNIYLTMGIIEETEHSDKNEITYADGSTLTTDGSLRINLSSLVGPQYARALFRIFREVDEERITTANFKFYGAIASIENLKNLSSSLIYIFTFNVNIKEYAMENLNNCTLEIPDVLALKLHDYSLANSNNTTIKIGSANPITCGLYVCMGSENLTVISNEPLINIPLVLVYNSNATHKLGDISTIISTATEGYGIDISDIRDLRIESVLDHPSTTYFKVIPVIKFRTISTLLDVSIVLPPDDWFWCYRLDPNDEAPQINESNLIPDFIAADDNTRSYKYITHYRNETERLNAEGPRPGEKTDFETFIGLRSTFAPTTFEYMGVTFTRKYNKRDHTENGTRNVTLWALYSGLEAAKEQKEAIFTMLRDTIIEEIFSAVIMFIIGAIITFFTAGAGAAILAPFFITIVRIASKVAKVRKLSSLARGIGFRLKVVGRHIVPTIRRSVMTTYTRVRPSKIKCLVDDTGDIVEIVKRMDDIPKTLKATKEVAPLVKKGAVTAKRGSTESRAIVRSKRLPNNPVEFRTQAEPDTLVNLSTKKPATSLQGRQLTKAPNQTRDVTLAKTGNIDSAGNFVGKKAPNANNTTFTGSVREQLAQRKAAAAANAPAQELKGAANAAAEQAGAARTQPMFTETLNVPRGLSSLLTREGGLEIDTVSINEMYSQFSSLLSSYFPSSLTMFSDKMRSYRQKKQFNSTLLPYLYNNCHMGLWVSHILEYVETSFRPYPETLESSLYNVGAQYPGLKSDLLSGLDANIHEYVTYNVMTQAKALFGADMENQKTHISEPINVCIEKGAYVDLPTYMEPSTFRDVTYDTDYKAYRIQYYLNAITNAQPHTFYKDVRGSGNALSNRANALMKYGGNLWNGIYLSAPSTPFDAPISGGFFDTTPRISINKLNDELYLGTRNVEYDYAVTDELPNTVYCGVNTLSVMLPNNTVSIPTYAYCGSNGTNGLLPLSMKQIAIPLNSTVLDIGYKAFYRSNLHAVNFPPSLRSIAEQAFSNSNLTDAKFITKVSEFPELNNLSITLSPTSVVSNSNYGTAFTNISILTFTDGSGALVTYTDIPYFEVGQIGSLTVTNITNVYFNQTYAYTGNMTVTYSINDPTKPYTLLVASNTTIPNVITIDNIASNATVSGVTEKLYTQLASWVYDRLWYQAESWDTPQTKYIVMDENYDKAYVRLGPSSKLTFNGITTNVYIGEITPPTTRSRGFGVTIGENAFANSKIETLTLPPYIDSIGANAFANNPISMIRLTGALPLLDQINLTFFQQLPAGTTITVPQMYIQAVMDLFAQAKLLVPSLSVFIRLDMANVPIFPSATGENCFVCHNPAIIYSSTTVQKILDGRPVPDQGKFVNWLTLGMTRPGMCFRALGRAVRVYKTVRRSPRERGLQMLQYVFQQIQYIGGTGSEGIDGSPTDIDPYCTGWVCVYSADGKYPVF